MTSPTDIRRRLLRHYRRHARDLPWRRTRDPYRIWLSEVMLQQTRVAVAMERYVRFLERFPDVTSLAEAPVELVAEEWAGLGYYGRARRLHEAAREIVSRHQGRLPEDEIALRRLPGIGSYTAAAIASIAYNRRAPAIDGNVERVLARVLADAEVRRGRRTSRLENLAASLTECSRPGDVNQALMDLGATVCTPRRPRCDECPLEDICRGSNLGAPERFPSVRDARPSPRLDVAFAWIPGRTGLWLERRPLGARWSGLWQLPGEEGPRARSRLAARLGFDQKHVLARVRHHLSPRRVHAVVYATDEIPRLARRADTRPYPRPLDAPLSALARKAILAVQTAAHHRTD